MFSGKTLIIAVFISGLLILQKESDAQKKAERLPNIVLILADDFGVGNIQANYPQNKIATPFLDKLCKEGMYFTDAHSGAASCTPSRYGILTGRYSWRTKLQTHVLACYEPPLISKDHLTLPGFLRENSYQTACIGKWHLGWMWPGDQPSTMGEYNVLQSAKWDFTRPVLEGPTTRGFDYYFGTDVPNFPPYCFIENNRTVGLPEDWKATTDMDGITGAMLHGWKMDRILPELTKRAVSYINKRSVEDKPFFLFFSMTAPHEPVRPTVEFANKSGIAPVADFIMETDWSIGEIVKAIDSAGIADNTLVIFAADNGQAKYTGFDKLIAAGHYPSGEYRGGKGDISEGGHRVPLIVRWPGLIPANSKNAQMVSLTDLFSTCAALIDKRVPADMAEDSRSFLPALFGREAENMRNDMINHSGSGEFAIRKGKWKLVFAKPQGAPTREPGAMNCIQQLYNLAIDPIEKENVITEHPDIVKELTSLLQNQISRGRSTPGPSKKNDSEVSFTAYPKARWAN